MVLSLNQYLCFDSLYQKLFEIFRPNDIKLLKLKIKIPAIFFSDNKF